MITNETGDVVGLPMRQLFRRCGRITNEAGDVVGLPMRQEMW